MILAERDIQAVEQRLAVTVPPSFRRFVTAHRLADFIPAEPLHPTTWWRVRHDDRYTGPPGIVFAEGIGGDYWLLLADEEAPGVLGAAIWTWDFHDGAMPKRVARTIDELPTVLEALADALLRTDPDADRD